MKSNQPNSIGMRNMTLSWDHMPSARQQRRIKMCSFCPHILGTTMDDDKNKESLYKFYDFTKGGTDLTKGWVSTPASSRCAQMGNGRFLLHP